MAGIVIAGFAGIGKTTLANKYKNVIDLESSLYKYDNSGLENIPIEQRKETIRKENKDFPLNYIEEIQKQVENYDIVLVFSYPPVLDIYDKYNIKYILCYPEKEPIDYYRQRYTDRGNNQAYISKMIDTYEERKKEFDERNAPKIILKGNETLEDYLINNGYKLIKRRNMYAR